MRSSFVVLDANQQGRELMAQATPDAETVVRSHAAMWNEQSDSKIPEVIDESYIEYNPVAPGGEIHGRDDFEDWMREITASFPDFHAEIIDLLVDEEIVMVELEFTMHHEGEFNGVPPTGGEITFQAMGKFLVRDGKVQELRNYFDPRKLFEQLGVTDESTEP